MLSVEPLSVEPRSLSSADSARDGLARPWPLGELRGAVVLWMYGEHDLANAAELSDVIGRAIDRSDADLVVDLSGVEFLSAATFTVLRDASLRLHAQGRYFTARSPSTCARRLLDLCDPGGLLVHPPAGSATLAV